VASKFPQTINFGALSNGDLLYAEKIEGGSNPSYHLYRLTISIPNKIGAGSISTVTSIAKNMIRRDEEQHQSTIARQKKFDEKSIKFQNEILSLEKIETPKKKEQETRNFRNGILIFVVIGIVLWCRATFGH